MSDKKLVYGFVYFSHPYSTFGSPDADAARRYIEAEWPGAYCLDHERPDDFIRSLKSLDFMTGVKQTIQRVRDESGAIVVLSHDNQGFISKGVFSEIGFGLKAEIPVYCYVRATKDHFDRLVRVTGIARNDPDDWKGRYGKLLLEAP